VGAEPIAGEISKDDAVQILDAFAKIDSVLALFDFNPAGSESEDPEIETLVNRRDEARERKEYQEADRIREELRLKNIVVEDTPYGTIWWAKS
jgi:cysteinyl-tRNA synthetase